jgi:hypothetical protein
VDVSDIVHIGSLNPFGWNSFVINPSDIPKMSKQTFTKTDRIDTRKLSKFFKKCLLVSITVPEQERERE